MQNKEKEGESEGAKKRDGSRGGTMWDKEIDCWEEMRWRKSCRRDGQKERLDEKGRGERSSTSDVDVEGEWVKNERLGEEDSNSTCT